MNQVMPGIFYFLMHYLVVICWVRLFKLIKFFNKLIYFIHPLSKFKNYNFTLIKPLEISKLTSIKDSFSYFYFLSKPIKFAYAIIKLTLLFLFMCLHFNNIFLKKPDNKFRFLFFLIPFSKL